MNILYFFSSLITILLFTPPPTTTFYPLSLHDALPISSATLPTQWPVEARFPASSSRQGIYGSAESWLHSTARSEVAWCSTPDRKSTRLNSSHLVISYAVFCLKKKIYIILIAEHLRTTP